MTNHSIDRTASNAAGWARAWTVPLSVRVSPGFLAPRAASDLGAAPDWESMALVELTDRPAHDALDGVEGDYALRLFHAQPGSGAPGDGFSIAASDEALARAIAGAAHILIGSRGHLVRLASRTALPSERLGLHRQRIVLPSFAGRTGALVVGGSQEGRNLELGPAAVHTNGLSGFLRALPNASVVVLREASKLGDQELIEACLASGRGVVATCDAVRVDGALPRGLVTLPDGVGDSAWKDALEQVRPGILPAL